MTESISLAKAKLFELDAKFENVINREQAVEVQFNPDSLKVSFANQLQTPKGDQKGTQARQFVGEGTTKLNVTLWFDVNAPQPEGAKERDVRKLTQKVAYFITPNKVKGKFIPPAVRFVWGSFQFDGLMDSLDESLEFFSNEGIPQRASVTMAVSQQRIIKFVFAELESAPPGAAGTSGSPVGTEPLTTATSGDTVQSIAAASGRRDWQSVATANGIENPRRLQVGQVIDLNV